MSRRDELESGGILSPEEEIELETLQDIGRLERECRRVAKALPADMREALMQELTRRALEPRAKRENRRRDLELRISRLEAAAAARAKHGRDS